MNKMQEIYLEKVVLNIGIGSTETKYDAAKTVLERITGHKPYPTRAKRRYPEFGIRKNQIIGAAVTLRGKEAKEMLEKALDAVNNKIQEKSITNNTFSFGISEYIYLPNMKYDPSIGMFGLHVHVTFARKGKRVEERKRMRSKVKRRHKIIKPEEIKDYLIKNFNTKIVSE